MFTSTIQKIKKKIILFIIRRIIGHFISNTIDLDSIDINDNGFKIKEIEINPNIFDSIHDVLNLKSSLMMDLEVNIPWCNILTQNSILNIDKLYITFDWHVKEEININKLAETILCDALDLTKYENYLDNSVNEDESYLTDESDNYRDKHIGLEYIRSTIQSVIENIKFNINLIDIRINFPNDRYVNVQFNGVNIVKTDGEYEKYIIKKTISIDEITVLINEDKVITIKSPVIYIWNQNNCVQNNTVHIYGIKSNIKLINAYLNHNILENALYIIKDLRKGFKNDGTNTAKPFQIDLNISIEQWKLILELSENNQICSISNNITLVLENRPTWGGFKPKTNSLSYLDSDYEQFPLDISMTPREESLLSSIYSTVTRQITKFKLSIMEWETYELLNEHKIDIIKPYEKDVNQLEVSFDGGLFDKVNIRMCPILIIFDINIIKRYLSIIKLFDILEDGNKLKSIFKQKSVCVLICQLVQVIINIPISKSTKSFNDTKYNIYEESLFVDIHDLMIDFKTNSSIVTCQKILGNLLEKNNIINFLTAKGQKEKPLVFTFSNNQLFEPNNMSKNIKWIKEGQVKVGKDKIYVNQIVDNIDVLNRDVMRKSKTIIKLNLRNVTLYLNHKYLDTIRNLTSELMAWESPFVTTESFYTLFNIKINALSINITHPKFGYTILGESINVLTTINFMLNHKYTYIQVNDAYLYNNITKKIILRREDSEHFVRIAIEQQNVHNLSYDILKLLDKTTIEQINKCNNKSNISIEFGKITMNSNQKEFCKYDNESNFWIFNLIDFFKQTNIQKKEKEQPKFYVNVKQLNIIHKIWNIPTLLLLQLNDIQFTNELTPIYSIQSDYLTISLLMNNREITVLQNKCLHVAWKDGHIEIINDQCVIELCSDTVHIIQGIINEYNKKIEKLTTSIIEYNSDWESDDDSELEIVGRDIKDTKCNFKQLEEIEAMINDAIRPAFDNFSSIGTLSIYHVKPNIMTQSYGYNKFDSIIYSSKVDKNNQYLILKDLDIDIRLYSGLDTNNTRNNSVNMTCHMDKINIIHYKSEDNRNTKLFVMIRNIMIDMVSNRSSVVLKPDISLNFQSWSLINNDDIALFNNIYCINDVGKITHFLDWSNHINVIIDMDDITHDYLINMQPLIFNLNQESIDFIKEFTIKNNSLDKYFILEGDYIKIDNLDEMITIIKPDDIDINIIINQINITINYKSSIFDLSWNKTATILNFVNLDETSIKLKEFSSYNSKGDTIIDEIILHYTNQIKNNNNLNIIGGLSPVKTVINIGSGLVNLIIIPSTEGLKNSRWKYGFRKSIQHFKSSTLSEFANIGYKIVNVADRLINNKDETITLTVPSNEYNANNLSKIILKYTKHGIRSGKNNMLKLKDNLSGKTEKEKMQELLRNMEFDEDDGYNK